MAMSPGTIVGGYRIQRVLGTGGMGTVYLAKHPALPRMDALKVLSQDLSQDEEFRARFEREANLAAGLDHPNIVSVYNRGEEHGQLWIAMQYIDGTDAAAEIARAPQSMTPARALRIVTEVGKGLDYAHRRALLHRDVKPANFLLSRGDDDERVLLTDFGVAKSTEDANELTQTGSFLATIAYAPPEQLSGDRLDHRADIYSLACSFFKLLTGRNPYPSTQPALVMMGHLHEPPPRATDVNPHLPPAVDQVFARAMAKNPAERYASCREFTDAAADALFHNRFGGPAASVATTRPGSAPASETASYPRDDRTVRQTPPARSRRGAYAAAGIAAVLIVAAGATAWALNQDTGNPAPPPVTTSTTSSQAPVANTVDEARAANPAFQGTRIIVTDVTGGGDTTDTDTAVYLEPTEQTQFLESLGFVYNSAYTKGEGETSPRPLTGIDSYGAFTNVRDGYLVALRSDARAGGGGLLGLPVEITNARATVVVVDDPATVEAFRNWSDTSEQVLVEKLVPILRAQVK